MVGSVTPRTHPREAHLQGALDRLAEVRWGLGAYLERVQDFADGGFPSGGSGGSSASAADPTGSDRFRLSRDPARAELRAFDREAAAVFAAAQRLHERYARYAQPQEAPARMSDPGCELCAEVTLTPPMAECKTCRPFTACPEHEGYPHWSATYVSSEIDIGTPSKPKRAKRRMCYWCWQFSRPVDRGGRGRLPSKEERHAHATGRRVRVGA